MSMITHKNGRQLVPPGALRDVLRAAGDTLERPRDFVPGHEWDTGSQACATCSQSRGGEHEDGCPLLEEGA